MGLETHLRCTAKWRRKILEGILLLACLLPTAHAQDASLAGIVSDTIGHLIEGAAVEVTNPETGFTRGATSDSVGWYFLGSLPRGRYSLLIEKAGYQRLQVQGIELRVGARDEQNFTLAIEASPALEAGADSLLRGLPRAPALPVETVASSVSVVVDESKILQLPLESRNIYSLFLLQPGVTSQGAIVRRGLSFSVHGQRVSGSNYMLDGVDNNNIVLTGPVTATSADAVQEFRMVNSSFSAENGRATAFVAHVATRSGTNRFHGNLFEYFSHDRLAANTFENNSNEVEKPPLRRNQFGFGIAGPILPSKLFFSNGLEFSRLRNSQNRTFTLPSSDFIEGVPQGSEALRLLTEIPPLPSTPTPANPAVGETQVDVPDRIDTLLLNARVDQHLRTGTDRLMFRYTLSSTSEERSPEFSGYPGLQPTDRFRGHNTLLAWTHSFEGDTNDLRIGWSRERGRLPRPHQDVPILQAFEPFVGPVSLPGSPRQSAVNENNNVLQITDGFRLNRGRSTWSFGFDFRRNFSNGLTLGLQNEALGGDAGFPDGFYQFFGLEAFALGQPDFFGIAVDRFSQGQLKLPELDRLYRSNEYAGFVQNDLKISPRLSLNLGLRYEYFGVLHSTDRSRDFNFYFGPGSTIEQRLASGELRSSDQNPGDLEDRLYRPDLFNFSPVIGLAWDVSGTARTVLRAGYALALDRIFDTIRDLRSNAQQVVACFGCAPRFVVPAEGLLPELDQNLGPGLAVQLDENLRTPYAQNWFVGLQHRVAGNMLLEVGNAASVGRKLISRDTINRQASFDALALNPSFLEVTSLSNAGNSNYLSFEAGLRQPFSNGLQYQFSYTYSHAIDNQSDIFEGVRIGPRPRDFGLASFTRQFDARVDRGSANFDQRHNFVFNAIWELPGPQAEQGWQGRLLRGWSLSVIGAYRTGFPATVISSILPFGAFRNNRVDFVGAGGQQGPFEDPPPVKGGVQWLNAELFRPTFDEVGNLGRGSIKTPGFWNYDFGVLRNVSLKENLRIQFRAEFYNLFNHANLSIPVTQYVDPTSDGGDRNPEFGRAYFGLNRVFSRFGDLSLENPSRRVQFALRLQF